MDGFSLPHAARVIEGKDFVIAFGSHKVVFISEHRSGCDLSEQGMETHYTLHAGPGSGVIDLHETKTFADGQKRHRTLFAWRTEGIPALAQQLVPMLYAFLSLLRPLRLGWMMHRGIGVARGIDPVGDQDIAAVTRKRKRRLILDRQLYEKNVFIPEYLEEIYEFPDGSFALFDRRRKIGLGFKVTDPGGNARLFWIKRRDLLRFCNYWQQHVIDALRSAAIPPERYAEYPFLRP